MTRREALLQIKKFIFHCQLKDATPKIVCYYHYLVVKLREFVHCWKVKVVDIDDKEPIGI